MIHTRLQSAGTPQVTKLWHLVSSVAQLLRVWIVKSFRINELAPVFSRSPDLGGGVSYIH